ncbi:MAG: hypothetical protein AAGM84_18030 [Pseudomonadota bacterium]
MKQLVLAAALALPTALSAETVCDMGGAEVVPVFEPVKAAFLSGDFAQFAQLTTRLMPTGPAAFGEGITQLEGLFPDGFESCQTIVQRTDKGGMVQEVTTFNIRGNLGPMSLYLLAAPLRGEMEISNINFNTTMSKVLDSLR